jgi:hypothetical protein
MQDATGVYESDFSSLLDNVRIWNRVITASEVADIFATDAGSGIGGETEIIVGTTPQTEITSIVSVFPNPAKTSTINVAFRLPAPSAMKLTLLNQVGSQIGSWVYEKGTAEGVVTIAAPAESGLYFLRVEAQNFRKILKVMIVK